MGDDLRAGSAHLAGNHKLAGVRGSVCRLPHDRWTIGSGKPDQQTLYKGHHLLNDRNRFGLSSCASLSSVLCDARLDDGGLIPDDIGAPASTQDPGQTGSGQNRVKNRVRIIIEEHGCAARGRVVGRSDGPSKRGQDDN